MGQILRSREERRILRAGGELPLTEQEQAVRNSLLVEAPMPTPEEQRELYDIYRRVGGSALPSHEDTIGWVDDDQAAVQILN